MIVALSAVLGMFGGVLTASPALAGRGPKWEFVPAPPTVVLDRSLCGFPVRMTSVSREFAKILKTPDGSIVFLITGSFAHSYTNLTTGKTITENASASARLTTNADGSGMVATRGRTPVIFSPDEAQRFDLPTVAVLAGALTYSVDPDGNITSLSLHGHVLVDVCAALS
jgi:hypothetical protein